MRVAAAPITWGVCEVPGWGRVLEPATVLGEMATLGISATELGPPGYLPSDPGELVALLDRYSLGLVGGFFATALHDPESTVDKAGAVAELLAAAGGEVLVLAAATGLDGYDERPALSAAEWATLIDTARLIAERAAVAGLRTVLHPHVGTHVETRHLLIGGTDPVELVRRHPDRVGHVHLKDVRADLAAEVRDGRLSYTDAVGTGIYVPLGTGDVDLAALMELLRDNNYSGWYVLEQDTALPVDDNAADRVPRKHTRQSLDYLATLGNDG